MAPTGSTTPVKGSSPSASSDASPISAAEANDAARLASPLKYFAPRGDGCGDTRPPASGGHKLSPHSSPSSSFSSMYTKYEMGDVIGTGAFSEVRICMDRYSKERFAVKIIDKSKCKGKEGMIQSEIAILQRAEHPNIIRLLEMFESSKNIYLVMELVTGGELFDQILNRGFYSEYDASNIVFQMLCGVEYLHSQGICHRDLKPENLLFSDKSDSAYLKIGDFGLSKIFDNAVVMQTACGTPGYVAPEVLVRHGYDHRVDMWSTGVITYILLCGYPPFFDENNNALFEKIMQGTYTFDSPFWDTISDEAKDFVERLLLVDPARRMTAQEALRHPFISSREDQSYDVVMSLRVAHLSENSPMKMHYAQDAKTGSVSTKEQFTSNPEICENSSPIHPRNHLEPTLSNLRAFSRWRESERSSLSLIASGKSTTVLPENVTMEHDNSKISNPVHQSSSQVFTRIAFGHNQSTSQFSSSGDVKMSYKTITNLFSESNHGGDRARNTEYKSSPDANMACGGLANNAARRAGAEANEEQRLFGSECDKYINIPILSYNIGMKAPTFRSVFNQQKSNRLAQFTTQFMKNYSVICLQDFYTAGSYRLSRIVEAARTYNLNYVSKSFAGGRKILSGVTDNGLLTLSKFPIIYEAYISFRNSGTSSGLLFGRGALYSRIQIFSENQRQSSPHIHVFNTSFMRPSLPPPLDSSQQVLSRNTAPPLNFVPRESSIALNDRRRMLVDQAIQLRDFILKCVPIKAFSSSIFKEPILIVGDFGCSDYPSESAAAAQKFGRYPEYSDILSVLRSSGIPLSTTSFHNFSSTVDDFKYNSTEFVSYDMCFRSNEEKEIIRSRCRQVLPGSLMFYNQSLENTAEPSDIFVDKRSAYIEILDLDSAGRLQDGHSKNHQGVSFTIKRMK